MAHLDPSRIRAITFDLRRHGDSGRTDHGYDLEQIADDTMAVADAVGSTRFVTVGFSMAAKFVQFVACAHSDRVVGQVLVAGCAASALPLPPELLEDWYGRSRTSSGTGWQVYILGVSAIDRLAATDVPRLVIGGRDDAFFSPEALTSGVVAPVRGARLELVDCGHEIPIERRELAALINEFVADVASPASLHPSR